MNTGVIKKKHGFNDIFLAIVVVAIVVVMIIPIPVILLDLLIAINIALALIILLVGMYVREPLELSIFPSLLLFTTLFSLALNISATRHILLHAYAGKLISAFGDFVVGGNYVVGIVIFIILVVVQNVVIITGSQRVAEVAARLDAMPGKQMAVSLSPEELEERERQRELIRKFYRPGLMQRAIQNLGLLAALLFTIILFPFVLIFSIPGKIFEVIKGLFKKPEVQGTKTGNVY